MKKTLNRKTGYYAIEVANREVVYKSWHRSAGAAISRLCERGNPQETRYMQHLNSGVAGLDGILVPMNFRKKGWPRDAKTLRLLPRN